MGEIESEQVLGRVRRNREQEFRVSVGSYCGKPYVYCKVYPIVEPPPGVEARHPGLTMRADNVRDLLPLLTQALEVAEIRERAKCEPDEGSGGRHGGKRRW